jgi:hypothetical protein
MLSGFFLYQHVDPIRSLRCNVGDASALLMLDGSAGFDRAVSEPRFSHRRVKAQLPLTV